MKNSIYLIVIFYLVSIKSNAQTLVDFDESKVGMKSAASYLGITPEFLSHIKNK
jgi:hypothetical protein